MLDAVGWLARAHLAAGAVLVILAGCGEPRPPVYASLATRPLRQPTQPACTNASDCERRCAGGDVRACSDLGDLIHARDWDRATRLWKGACAEGDGAGCLRAMAILHDEQADAAAAKACAAGFASACGLLGRVQLLRGLSRWSGDARDAMVRDAVHLLERSCRLEDWTGCMTAAAAHIMAGARDARSNARLLGARAAELADKACSQSDAVACVTLAGDRDKQGDRDGATAYYARACALELDVAAQLSPAARAEVAAGDTCKTLTGRGARLPEPLAPTGGIPRVARESAEARRIAGVTQIHPPVRVKAWMYSKRMRRLTTRLQVCMSPVGLVEGVVVFDYSGSPGWDAALVQAVRRWRFRPYLVDDVPTPVCAGYTFIYNQK